MPAQETELLAGSRRFQDAVASLPNLLAQLVSGEKLDIQCRLRIPQAAGVYLFSESKRPLYIGQTRKLRSRYDQHTKPEGGHNQASFAFLIAKAAARFAGVDVASNRDDLEAKPEFKPHFLAAKLKVAAMSYQYIAIDDPIVRTLFEVYSSLHLGTEEFNSFETH